jgi:hypothetical protein
MSEKIRERKVGLAVLSHKHRGYALACDGGSIEVLEDPAIVVAVHVDEAGSERKSIFIADRLAGAGRELFPDCNDVVTLDADVCFRGLFSAAVVEQNVLDENVRGKANSGGK